jgi:hypothetical protein
VYEATQDPTVYLERFAYLRPQAPPHHLPFRLYDFRHTDIIEVLVRAIREGHDIFFEKCREMGMASTDLDVVLWFWTYEPGSNFLLGSRKEANVDNSGSGWRRPL